MDRILKTIKNNKIKINELIKGISIKFIKWIKTFWSDEWIKLMELNEPKC